MFGSRRWTVFVAVGALVGASGTLGLGDVAGARADTVGSSDSRRIEAAPAESSMVSLVPARLLETRTDAPATVDGQFSGIGIRDAGSVTELVVAGRGGVAADASAVVLNVTVTETQGPGFVTVWPCGSARPTASNLNYQTGSTIPNAVVAKVGVGGKVCLFTMAPAHLIADVNAYFPAVSSMVSLVPARLLDSRIGGWDSICHPMATAYDPDDWEADVPLGGTVELTGYLHVPIVFAHDGTNYPLTFRSVVSSSGVSDAAWKCDMSVRIAVGYGPNQIEPLPAHFSDSDVRVRDAAGTVITGIDLDSTRVRVVGVGTLEYGGDNGLPGTNTITLQALASMAPSAPATVDGQFSGIGMRDAGSVTELVVAGRGGVAADASAVVLNVTVTETQGPGFVTVWPCGSARPTASNLNYQTGSTIPNAVVAKVGVGGKVCLFTMAPAHLIADVNAYFPAVSSMVSLVPARLLETRTDAPATVDGQFSGIGVRAANSVTELVVAGRGGVAADASAVVLNVTVTETQGPGFVTVWPCGSARPTASNLNYQTGSTIPNAVFAKVGVDGKVCLFTMAPVHLIADVNAYFEPSASSSPPSPPPPTPAAWDEVCQPMATTADPDDWIADVPLGSTVELTGYLYVKSTFVTSGTNYPFTFRSVAYSTGVSDSPAWKCDMSVRIAVGYGPNQVEPLPTGTFSYSDVRVRDAAGAVITGWTGILDSKPVRVVGVGTLEYGGDNGLPGTNTITLQTLEAVG